MLRYISDTEIEIPQNIDSDLRDDILNHNLQIYGGYYEYEKEWESPIIYPITYGKKSGKQIFPITGFLPYLYKRNENGTYKDYLGNKVINTETYPRASIVRYHFPARDDLPPVKLTGYDGGLKPARPDELADNEELPLTGGFYIGESGKMLAEFAKKPKLLGPAKSKNCKLP